VTFLRWQLEWGKHQDKLKAIGVNKSSPKLYEDLIGVWEGFLDLSSSRTSSTEVYMDGTYLKRLVHEDPIKFVEIESWLNLNDIRDVEMRQEIVHLIRVLDSEYLQFRRQNR